MNIQYYLFDVEQAEKRRNKALPLSIYNPNEHAVLPGLHIFPRTLEKEDPHNYDYIDDTLVYSDLCKNNIEDKESTMDDGPPDPPLPETPN